MKEMSSESEIDFEETTSDEEVEKLFAFQNTDLALVVEGKSFHVNKKLLKQLSPVFKTMLERDFKEKEQTEIPLPGKSYKDFDLFLKILYLGQHDKLDMKSSIRLYPLTHEYQTPITQRCEEVMARYVSLTPTSLELLVDCLLLAETYDLESILEKAINTTAKIRQSEVLNNEKFSELSEKTRRRIAQRRVHYIENFQQPGGPLSRHGVELPSSLSISYGDFNVNRDIVSGKTCFGTGFSFGKK